MTFNAMVSRPSVIHLSVEVIVLDPKVFELSGIHRNSELELVGH